MGALEYDQIVIILASASAIFMICGLIWFTTPFRKRRKVEDKLFFALELSCLSGILGEVVYFLMRLKMSADFQLPFTAKFYARVNKVFSAGGILYNALLLLFVLCALPKGEKILKYVKLPVLVFPIFEAILNICYSILPKAVMEPMTRVYMSGIFAKIYFVFLFFVLFFLCFVDKRLVLYYGLAIEVWFVLSKIIVLSEYTALIKAQVLVYTYIIVMKRALTDKPIVKGGQSI